MIDPAWASVGVIVVVNSATLVLMFKKNGRDADEVKKALSEWQGKTTEKLNNMEKSQQLCQSNVKENFKHMNGKIEKIADRVTHIQGAE